MRKAGVLLPITSLPSRYGIGGFSKEAYEFVDFLEKVGQSYWQILPMGPTGFGDSPYQSFSSFAGNPYFISLDDLIEEGLLTQEECEGCEYGNDARLVDYSKIYKTRLKLLEKAYKREALKNNQDYLDFVGENVKWLEDYALFMALKGYFGGKAWYEWDFEIKVGNPGAKEDKVHGFVQTLALGMDLKDLLTTLHIGTAHMDLPVKTAGTEQCGV